MKRRDFLKRAALLPAIVVAPDVLGRITPDAVDGHSINIGGSGSYNFSGSKIFGSEGVMFDNFDEPYSTEWKVGSLSEKDQAMVFVADNVD